MESTTTIRIKRSTKQKLDDIGRKGMTYDDIVRVGAIEVKNKESHYIWNVPMFNGDTCQESYIEIRVPKHISKLAVDEDGLVESLRYIMEENGIQEIEDPRDGIVF